MGSYLLIIHLTKIINQRIGAKGIIEFPLGYYIYVGSAMGKKGSSTILNRVKRHLRSIKDKKEHWHIDYFLKSKFTQIIQIILCPSKIRLECNLSQSIEEEADDLIIGFGCSDCNCNSHLFYFKEKPFKNLFKENN